MQRCRQLRKELKAQRVAVKRMQGDLKRAEEERDFERAERVKVTEQYDVAKMVNEQLAAALDADIERERMRAVAYATKRGRATIKEPDLY